MADYIWKSLLSEFIGTFTLVFVGASAVALTVQQGGSILTSAFAFGLALMTIIYVWGSYSGAHVNPAVSFGFAVAGQMNWGLMLGYWVAQLIGGIAAAALVAYFFGTATGAGASVGTLTNTNPWAAVLMEAILTFFLVIAYLFIYRNPMLALVSGLAVGLVLTFTFIAGGYLTGASTNPARSLGPAIFGNTLGSYWIYIVGPLLGALVAALVYKLFTINFSCCDKVDECGNKILDECGKPLQECKSPLLDNCGNPIKDCNGEMWETYTKHQRKLTHMQENPLMYIGEWMSSRGMDPRYIKQEIRHVIKGEHPEPEANQPETVINNIISTEASALGIQPPSPRKLRSLSELAQTQSPHKLESISDIRQAALSTMAPVESTTLMPPSQASQLMGNLTQETQLMGSPTQASRLMGSPAQASRLMSISSQEARLMSVPSQEAQLMGSPSQGTRLMSNPSQTSRLTSDPGQVSQLMSTQSVPSPLQTAFNRMSNPPGELLYPPSLTSTNLMSQILPSN